MRRPRYQLLADHLIEQITSGELPVGARIPSEYELCAEHEMSRGTVRQALRGLEDLGMISRSPTGTTVTAPRPVDAIGQLGTISIHTHRGDRYRIRTTFHPDDTGGL